MKKLIKSKLFIAGTLAVLCAAILTVCVLWDRDEITEFEPDPVPLAGLIDSWTENNHSSPAAKADSGDYISAGKQGTTAEQYPKMVEEKNDEVIIDFTDPNQSKDPPPETPVPDHSPVYTDPSKPPETPASEEPKTQGGGKSDTPTPGSKNEKGEVYDPVFGWVKPGNVEQTEIDSSGDPNKMVGNMG